MDKTKPFGLIISKRSQSFRPTTSAVFASDSDDEPAQKKMPKIPQAKPIKPAPCEDPSIYEYDSVYDEMKAQEVAKVAPKDANKPSKYIGSLLKAADKRKKDQERRVEKKVHHEREKEGDKFKDKEAFVTSSYKKKMQEMEEEEERERRENMLNDMMDVTKQKDLNGFYRHFLKQCVGEEKVPVFGERYSGIKQEDGIVVKEEKLSDAEDEETKVIVDKDRNFGSSGDGKSLEHVGKVSKKDLTKDRHGKGSKFDKIGGENSNIASLNDQLRDKDAQKNASNVEGVLTKMEHPAKASLLSDNIDQDSDNSSSEEEHPEKVEVSKKLADNVDQDSNDSSSEEEQPEKVGVSKKLVDNVDQDSDNTSSEEDGSEMAGTLKKLNKHSSKKSLEETMTKKRKRSPGKSQHRNIRKRTEDDDSLSEEPDSGREDGKSHSKENTDAEKDPKLSTNGEEKDTQPKKTREDIFAKRTVGEVFAAAQARYFQRMAARSA